jgi:flagellar motor switch protein FliN/FliY
MTEITTEEIQTQSEEVEMSDFLDVPMELSFVLGRKKMKVRDLLLLKHEYLIEIPKSAGENLDVYVNGKLIGYGEILDMEGSAGVRITDFHDKA